MKTQSPFGILYALVILIVVSCDTKQSTQPDFGTVTTNCHHNLISEL